MAMKKNADLREIPINSLSQVKSSIYPGNKLQISRYTWLTLVPKNLFEQFQRVSNIWFLIVSIFQLIPYQLNPTDSWTTIVPLSILLLITLVKDAYTDYKLHKKLEILNKQTYHCWDGTKFTLIQSEDILVGHFIELHEETIVPADMIIFAKRSEGRVFLDMTRLIGVPSLLEKKPIEKISRIMNNSDPETPGILKINGKVNISEPNSNYASFSATIKPEHHPTAYEVTTENLLYAGGLLKGTGPIIGFVVYCGEESRMRINASMIRRKTSKVEEIVNVWVLYMLIILVLLVIGSVFGFYYANSYSIKEESVLNPVISFTLLYNNIVPISLFMVIDIIRILQCWFLTYKRDDIHFNTEIANENLGQVEVLVTDKTGTISDTKLTVKVCVIGERKFEISSETTDNTIWNEHTEQLLSSSPRLSGTFYNSFSQLKSYITSESSTSHAMSFMKCLTLCNTLFQHNNEYLGPAEEQALIHTASSLGFNLKIYKKHYELETGQNVITYRFVCARPYDREKKRSRILLEDEIGGFGMLYAKGGLSAMLPLLNMTQTQADEVRSTVRELKDRGFRSMVLASKRISQAELFEQKSRIKRLKRSLMNTDGRIESLFREIEKNMKYLGIVSLSEEILPGAIETIDNLRSAGIKIWLASSDRSNHSFTVAKESGIIEPDSNILELKNVKSEVSLARALIKGVRNFILDKTVNGILRASNSNINVRRKSRGTPDKSYMNFNENEDGLFTPYFQAKAQESPAFAFRKLTRLDTNIDQILSKPFDPNDMNFSLLIDRKALNLALSDPDCRKLLVCVLCCAKAVVFSELMPRDKGNIVKLLRENVRYKPLIAAVGVGEGDIIMLQQSHVGIGISNSEDSLAMNYSDISINKFTQLNELLLIQGHYNYIRICKSIFLFLYKNCFLTTVLLAFTFFCSYSGTSIFNASLLVGYNIFFTTLPILVIGIFDEDVSAEKIMKSPQIYMTGIKNEPLGWKKLLSCLAISISQGFLLIVLTYLCMPNVITKNGYAEDLTTIGTFTYIALIFAVLIEIYIQTFCYTLLYGASIVFSIVFLVIFLSIVSNTNFPDSELIGVGDNLLKSPMSLISIAFSSCLCVIPTSIVYNYFELFKPHMLAMLKSNHSLMHFEVNKLVDYKECLSKIYKHSSGWKNKVMDQKFSIDKFRLRFKLLYIEKKYMDTFLNENLKVFKFTIAVLWILIMLWILFGALFLGTALNYTLARIVIVALCSIFLFFLWTPYFAKHYIFYICLFILVAEISKFALEASFHSTSLLATSLTAAGIFLALNVNWICTCLLSLINILLFTISLSIEYSEKYDQTTASLLILSAIIFITSITLTCGIAGYYCELSQRTEHKLLNQARSRIEKTQSILSIMLPPFVRNRVKEGIRYIAESQGDVSILFCDIVDFDKICREYHPYELTSFLDKLFSDFDSLCESTGVTKIETVGKTYMACAGLKDSDKDLPYHLKEEPHARRAVELAFAMIQEVKHVQLKNGNFLNVKIGINSGPVSAGVVGYHKPQFSLVGDTVNTASRMCSTLDTPNAAQISSSTYSLLKDHPDYEFASKTVYAKGKGDILVYLITEAKASNYDMAGGLGAHFTGIARGSFGSSGFLLEKVTAYESTKLASKAAMERSSKTWKKNILQNEDLNIIKNNPSLANCLKMKLDSNEFKFRIERVGKKYLAVFATMVIGCVNYGLIIMLGVLKYKFTDVYENESLIITRVVVFVLMIVYVIMYKEVYKRIWYPLLFMVCLSVVHIATMLQIPYSTLPPGFIGLEETYIILLMCHASHAYLGLILIGQVVIFLPYIVLACYSPHIGMHLSNIILVASFALLCIKALYSQEKHDRMNYNLSFRAKKEIKENEALLVQMMPPDVLENLENERVSTDRLHNVTLIFADIVGFTDWSSHKSPNEIVQMLSNLFTRFDKLCVEFDVYKVHTIGDCYVVMGYTGGKKKRDPSLECLNVLKMAYRMIEVIKEENSKHSSSLNMRIGVHTGEVIAGVIGTNIVRYDIWGPDVLIANKMESNGKPGRVKVSIDTREMIESRVQSGFEFEESDKIDVNAIGVSKRTFFVNCHDIELIKDVE